MPNCQIHKIGEIPQGIANYIILNAESLSHGVTSDRDYSDQIQHVLETYFNNPERIELESVKVKAQNVCTRAT